MTRDEAITQLRGRVRALLTQVKNNQKLQQTVWKPRPTELWPNSRIVRELEAALYELELPDERQAARKSRTLIYKGYTAFALWDAEELVYRGRVEGINDTVTFHGSTIPEANQAFVDSVEDYLKFCAEQGRAADVATPTQG